MKEYLVQILKSIQTESSSYLKANISVWESYFIDSETKEKKKMGNQEMYGVRVDYLVKFANELNPEITREQLTNGLEFKISQSAYDKLKHTYLISNKTNYNNMNNRYQGNTFKHQDYRRNTK